MVGRGNKDASRDVRDREPLSVENHHASKHKVA